MSELAKKIETASADRAMAGIEPEQAQELGKMVASQYRAIFKQQYASVSLPASCANLIKVAESELPPCPVETTLMLIGDNSSACPIDLKLLTLFCVSCKCNGELALFVRGA